MDDAGARVGPAVHGVVETEVDESIALLHPDSSQVYVLNATAADVWRLSDGELTLDGVVAALAVAYGATPESIRAEVAATVGRLRDDGLLMPAGG